MLTKRVPSGAKTRRLRNGLVAGEVSLAAEAQSFELPVPAGAVGERLLEIELRVSDPRAPVEAGWSADPRELVMAVMELAVTP